MRRSTAALFAGLVVVLAGCSDALPTRPTSVTTPRNNFTTAAALAISTMYCEPLGACEAWASGGTGGYSFTWTNAIEGDDYNGYSQAAPKCYSSNFTITVTATVTDSSGARASRSIRYPCGI